MKYPVISLFSGAMGLDLGLMKAGLDVCLSQDIEPACGKTMEANNHNHILGDIRELIKNDKECNFLIEKSGINPKELFAVVGGPPCQSFSTAGKRGGLNDPRGSLFKEFAHVVDTLRPRFFVMENVKGLLSSRVDPSSKTDFSTAFDIVKETFEDLGYKLVYGVLNSINYGSAQFRERLIILGSRDHENIYLPLPTHFQFHQNPELRWKTLTNVISDLDESKQDYTTISEKRLQFLKKIPMGGNWKYLSEDDQKLALGNAFYSGGGKTGFFRRLDLYEPAPTLVTSPIQKASMLCHPILDRPLSVQEYARIQDFPDNWIIKGTTSEKYRQIGNAVPVNLSTAIGQALLSVANQDFLIKSKRIKSNPLQEALNNIMNL